MANSNGTQPEHDYRALEAVNSGVKAVVTFMFAASVCYGFLFARIGNLTLVSPDAFGAIATAVILWWFKDRGDKERNKETAAIVAAASTLPPSAPPHSPSAEAKP